MKKFFVAFLYITQLSGSNFTLNNTVADINKAYHKQFNHILSQSISDHEKQRQIRSLHATRTATIRRLDALQHITCSLDDLTTLRKRNIVNQAMQKLKQIGQRITF